MAATALEAQLKAAVATYQTFQAEKTKLVTTRTQLQSQINENEMVLEELTRLNDDSNVFKMIGPALIKQDLVEAKSNVNKRVEYIKGEIGRLDGQLKSIESKSGERENEVGIMCHAFQYFHECISFFMQMCHSGTWPIVYRHK